MYSTFVSPSAMASNSPSIVRGISPRNSASWWLGPCVGPILPAWSMPYLHGPGFTAAGLPVGENSAVESSNHRADNRQGHFLVDFHLLRGGAEDAIKGEVILVLVDLGGDGGTARVRSRGEKETHS